MTNLAIRASGLEFRYGANPALAGLDLAVPQGGIYGLMGRNGSGKSTLLKILMNILQAHAGEVEVLGLEPRNDYLEIRRRVGYVPQESDFDPRMTIAETFEFMRPYFGDRWNAGLVSEKLERFGLSGMTGRWVGSLSTGQRQLFSLVTAIAIEPEVLLLDEPAAGLDAVVRRELAETVIELASEAGRTVLLSSHLLGEVEALAEHVGIIQDGRLLLQAPLEELKRRVLRLTVRFDGQAPPLASLPGFVGSRQVGDRWQLCFRTTADEEDERIRQALAENGARDVTEGSSDLESIFVDLVSGAPAGPSAELEAAR